MPEDAQVAPSAPSLPLTPTPEMKKALLPPCLFLPMSPEPHDCSYHDVSPPCPSRASWDTNTEARCKASFGTGPPQNSVSLPCICSAGWQWVGSRFFSLSWYKPTWRKTHTRKFPPISNVTGSDDHRPGPHELSMLTGASTQGSEGRYWGLVPTLHVA